MKKREHWQFPLLSSTTIRLVLPTLSALLHCIEAQAPVTSRLVFGHTRIGEILMGNGNPLLFALSHAKLTDTVVDIITLKFLSEFLSDRIIFATYLYLGIHLHQLKIIPVEIFHKFTEGGDEKFFEISAVLSVCKALPPGYKSNTSHSTSKSPHRFFL